MKTFALYDEFGQPLPGAAPSFAYFGNRTGAPAVAPTITDMGQGEYQFDDSTFVGQYVFLITAAGDVFPKFLSGAIFDDPFNPFAAVFFTNPDGTVWNGPNTGIGFHHYKSFSGSSLTPPSITRVNVTGPEQGLYTFNDTAPNVAAGIEWIVTAPTGAIPEYLDGNFFPDSGGAPPTTISLLSGAVFADHIILTFDKPVLLSPPASVFSNWVITGSPTITVSSLLVSGNTVRLNFNSTSNGLAYTLDIPATGITSTTAEPYIGPYTYPFNAVPPPIPTFISLIAGSVFTDHIILTFDKNVVLTPPSDTFSNWVISGGAPMIVSSLVVSTNTVRLNTNTIEDGDARILSIPSGIQSTFAEDYIGPFTFNFNAVFNAPVIHFVSAAVFVDHINLTFDKNVSLSSLAAIASNWVITGNPGTGPITVSSLSVSGAVVRLNINESQDGGAYILNFPSAGIQSTGGDIYLGPFTYNFTCVGVPPYIANAISLDSFTVRVFFSEAVVQADAIDPANYGVVPPLTIYSVTPETASIYVLTTSQQTPGQNYDLTASNIRDLHNNPI